MNWCRGTRAYKEKITTSGEIGQTVNSFARYARRRGDQAGGGSGEEGRGGQWRGISGGLKKWSRTPP